MKALNKKAYGFSLIEIMLVLGIATGLLLLAFMLNKSRQEGVSVEDARRQLTKIVQSIEPVKNTLSSYTQVIPANGLTDEQKKLFFPKELLGANGELVTVHGNVDVRSLSINSASDSYAISYLDTNANFCSQLASKTYDQFYQVRVGDSIDLSDPSNIVWTSGENFDPKTLTQMCSNMRGQKVVQFVSAPIKAYNGIASSSQSLNNNAIAPVSLEQALISAGAVMPAQSLAAITGPAASTGSLDVADGYNPNDVEAGGAIAPGRPDGSCNTANFTWGGGCSGSAPGGISSGSVVVVGNSASGYIGGVQLSCNSGVWTQGTGTCFPAGCASTGKSWGGGCSGNLPNARSGNSATINSTTTYDGSASFSCYMGTWTAGAASCTPPAPACPSGSTAGAQTYCVSYTPGIGCTEFAALTPSSTESSCPEPGPSGACGSAKEQSFASVPTSGLCSSGTATGVTTGATTYTWSCVGSNGGTTDSCWARKTAVPGGRNCPAVNGPLSWGGNACGANISQPSSPPGVAVTVNNTKAGATGLQNYICDGSANWQLISETCSVVTPSVQTCNVTDGVNSVSISGAPNTPVNGSLPLAWARVTGRLGTGVGTISAVSAPRNMPGGYPKTAWCQGSNIDVTQIQGLYGNSIWYPATNSYGGTRNNQEEFVRAFTSSIFWNTGVITGHNNYIVTAVRNFYIAQDGTFSFEFTGYTFEGGG